MVTLCKHHFIDFFPDGSIDNKSAFVQVVAWPRAGEKPRPETLITQNHWRHMASLGHNELFDENMPSQDLSKIQCVMRTMVNVFCCGLVAIDFNNTLV